MHRTPATAVPNIRHPATAARVAGAHDRSRPHSPRLSAALAFRAAMLACVLAGAAALGGCRSAPAATSPDTASTATAAQESSMTAVATPITAEEIGRRVLKLIDSIRSARDLAPEHIAQQTGLEVERNANDPHLYGFGGSLGEDWMYNLVSTPQRQGEAPTSLRFSFDDQTDGGNGDPAEICGLDFQDYRAALTAAGFDFKPMQGRRGIDAWYFTRGDVGVTAYTHGNADPAKGKACISKLIISAYA